MSKTFETGSNENIGVGENSVNAAGEILATRSRIAVSANLGEWALRGTKTVPIIGMLPPESQDAKPHSDRMRRATDAKPFTGAERRRHPEIVEPPEPTEVNVFHELGKALTSSLQLDQVLRTIMEKINEVLRPDTWSLLLMDTDKQELYFQIATGAGWRRCGVTMVFGFRARCSPKASRAST